MKTRFFSISLLALFSFVSLNAQQIDVRVDENVELMTILAHLSGYHEYRIHATSYADDVDTHFADYKDHPMIQYMMDIRKKNGIANDAVVSMAIRLERHDGKFCIVEDDPASLDSLDRRWSGVDKEAFFELLSDFYEVTHFDKFFQSHHDFYQKALDNYRNNVSNHLNANWFAQFYGKETTDKFSVIIYFCNVGSTYALGYHLKDRAREVSWVICYFIDDEGNPAYNVSFLPGLVNGYNEMYEDLFRDEVFMKDLEESGEYLFNSAIWSMYNVGWRQWDVVMGHSFSIAVGICYLMDNGYKPEEVQQKILYYMGYNMHWIPGLVKQFRIYQTKQKKYRTMENYRPEILKFFNSYAAECRAKIETVK